MKSGNWIPISKCFLKHLPNNRPYTKLEAAFSLQVDYDNKNNVTVKGYAELWQWSRGKVIRFLKDMNVVIDYPEDTRKLKNQNGHITVHKTDISPPKKGHIRLIENNDLQSQTDISRKKNGHKTDIKRYTTKEPKNLNPKKQYIEPYFGEFENVKLTSKEYEKLQSKFPDSFEDKIENLSFYLESKGAKYKSHYATILNWAKKDEKDKTGIRPVTYAQALDGERRQRAKWLLGEIKDDKQKDSDKGIDENVLKLSYSKTHE